METKKKHPHFLQTKSKHAFNLLPGKSFIERISGVDSPKNQNLVFDLFDSAPWPAYAPFVKYTQILFLVFP